MKKKLVLLAAFFLLLLSGCEKENNDSIGILGTWKPQDHCYQITLNKDYDYVNIFNAPWVGTVNINGLPIDFSENSYSIDNVMGMKWLYSNKCYFNFYSDAVTITIEGKTYILRDDFNVDIRNGIFTAKGTATTETGTDNINLEVNLKAQTLSMKKGIEYSIIDVLFFTKAPIQNITFSNNGKINGELMDIDICVPFEGTYSIKSENLNLSYNVFTTIVNYSYTYKMVDNTLVLTRPIEYSTYDIYSSIPKEFVSDLKYKISLKKEEANE